MLRQKLYLIYLAAALLLHAPAYAQQITRDHLIALTPEWHGNSIFAK